LLQSSGALVPTGYGSYSPSSGSLSLSSVLHVGDINLTHLFRSASYGEMYRSSPAVWTVVDKLADLTARLPLKVYSREVDGRPEAREHPYARLLRQPSQCCDRNEFWRRVSVHFDLFGEAILAKVRAERDEPTELVIVHPATVDVSVRSSGVTYQIAIGRERIELPESEVVHFKRVDPDNPYRGLSPLEPLRRTLDNTEAARAAQASFWARGARPGVALMHPSKISVQAAQRLKTQFDSIAAGAGKTGTTVVLEEGMEPKVMSLSAEEAQYIQTRKYDDREVFAAYHMPPTAVGDLEYATFANVTENLRSVYRDTIAPRLQTFESVLEFSLRPDFGEGVYAEWLMDEVLRGDFEQRAEAYQKAINAGWTTPAEVRDRENLPFVEGSDRLYINSTMIPLATDAADEKALAQFAGDAGLAAQRLGLAVSYGVLSADEARECLPGLDGPAPPPPVAPTADATRTELMASWNRVVERIGAATERRTDKGHSLTNFASRGRAITRDTLARAMYRAGADEEMVSEVAARAWEALEGDLIQGRPVQELMEDWNAQADGWADDVLSELESP
jgi:HK97 family phage portal protein